MLMESGACYGRISVVEASPAAVKLGGRCPRVLSAAAIARSPTVARISLAAQGLVSFCGSQQLARCSSWKGSFVTVANGDSSRRDLRSVEAPLEPRSSAGKFLSGILKNHPHIFNAAVAVQLNELAAERNDALARQKQSLGSTESCLHGRIAEMKDYECQLAVEEVMYMIIVHKFSEVEVPMVPRLSECLNNGRLEIWTLKDRELESIHTLDVLELVREHLSTVLAWKGKFSEANNWTPTVISKLQLGRIYGASIMYGYFLKSACWRHQLEQNFTSTDQDILLGHRIQHPLAERWPHALENLAVVDRVTDTISSLYEGSGKTRRIRNLKRYLMGFDSETLQRCAKLKSQEAVNLIEQHSWALFGDDEESEAITSKEAITITHSSLKRLVLEAVAFGSFLWDVERYVGSIYSLKDN